MLAVNKYPRDYVEEIKSKFSRYAEVYRKLRDEREKSGSMDGFEQVYFNNLLLALDSHFAHRARAAERKDGNPLNEVRMICSSLTLHDGVLSVDKTIKYDPAKAVLKYPLGQKIELTEAEFLKISSAYLDDLITKYT